SGGHIVSTATGPLVNSPGTTAWAGSYTSWTSAMVQVSYPWSYSGTESDGLCMLSNAQGGPAHLTLENNTMVTDAFRPLGSGASVAQGPTFSMYNAVQNNIVLGNGWNSGNSGYGEGNNTEMWQMDAGTNGSGGSGTLAACSNVWPTRTFSLYEDYANNSGYPGCTGGASASSWFPTTSYCSGASPSPTCVGFKGALSASSMPLDLADWHGYSLAAGTSFPTQGVNTSAIDTAQTLNTYVCNSTYSVCPTGVAGPFPDTLSQTQPPSVAPVVWSVVF